MIRKFTSKDYDEYASWWGKDTPPKISSLPKIGIVYGDMEAVGFLADTDTDFAIITWWYVNPSIGSKKKHKALSCIMDSLCYLAEMIGKRWIFCYSNKKSIIRLLESKNFINYDGHIVREVL